MSLAGRGAVISGASSGIGAAVAEKFADAGISYLLLLARNQEKLNGVRSSILSKHPSVNIEVVSIDVGDHAALKALGDEKRDLVDIVVANAGFCHGMPAGDQVDMVMTQKMFDTNVIGVIGLITAFGPSMRSRGDGDIVVVSSIAGTETYACGAVYCATKHALQGYVNSLRMDLVATRIRVSSICPGLIADTSFSLTRFGGDEKKVNEVYKGIETLKAADIAVQIHFVVSQPPHVQIADIKSYPTHQAHARYVIHRDA